MDQIFDNWKTNLLAAGEKRQKTWRLYEQNIQAEEWLSSSSKEWKKQLNML